MRLRYFFLSFLVLFLLVACSNQARLDSFVTEQPSLRPSVATFTPTKQIGNISPSNSPIPIVTTQVTQSYTSTPTAQPLPTGTSTLVNFESLPKLSDVVISPLDIKNNDYFSWNPLILATDITNELGDSCLRECVKYKYSLKYSTLTIILLRAGDNQKAKKVVENLRNEFFKSSADAYVYTVKDIPTMPPTSWVLIDAPSRTKDFRTGAASIAHGNIVILVTYSQDYCDYIPQFGRYCEGPVGELAENSVDILNWQIQNLIAAGYPK